MKGRLDRPVQRRARRHFLLQTGEDDDVGVHRHTDRKNDAGDTGQRQRKVKGVEQDQHQRRVEHQRERSDQTRKQVRDGHDDHDQQKSDSTADQRGVNRLLSQLGADHVGPDLVQRHLQSADSDVGGKLLGLIDRTHALDDGLAVCDGGIDLRHRDEGAVIVDADGLPGRVCLRRRVSELLRAVLREAELNHILIVLGCRILLHTALGVRHVRSLADNGSVLLQLLDRLVVQLIPAGRAVVGIVLVSVRVRLSDEVQ